MISIRHGKKQDSAQISRMLLEISKEFIFGELSDVGKQTLISEFAVEKIAEKLTADNFLFFLAEENDHLIGVIAVQDNKHICYLCVAKSHHKQGISSALWKKAKEESLLFNDSKIYTVNASNYAVKAYERLGFVLKEKMQEKNGVLFNPMEMSGG